MESIHKGNQEALKRIKEAKKGNETELNLSGLALTTVPEEILDLTDLIDLNLSNNLLDLLPENFGKLTKLEELDLSANQFITFPEVIGKLVELKYLRLSSNQLKTLPDIIGKLSKLDMLVLKDNEFSSFPENVLQLKDLRCLYFDGNLLSTLPDDLSSLEELEELGLSNNQFISLPDSVSTLNNLDGIWIQRNNLKELPASISKLTSLRRIIAGNNQLTEFPVVLTEIDNLEAIYLENNQLSKIPKAIKKLTKLGWLHLRKNKFSIFPEAIEKLPRLQSLSIEDNQLTTIPETIGKLTQLTGLYLKNNQLTELPETIGKLTKLDILDLENNQLKSLPDSIESFTNLRTLHLENNQFKFGQEVYELPPDEQIKEILKWQRAQQAGTLRPIHEAKVIFIGESNFGKTHLIEMLRKGTIGRKIKTTHGIERSQLGVPYGNQEIRLNIWDLGGQEFMRSTHQFFFSERTLYVLVTLARRERNELNHWLKLANQLGNKAPVLVVINKIDQNPHDVDRRSLERDYPNIIGFVRTCIYDCDESKATDTMELLKKKVIAAVSDKELMPGVFEERPPEWFTVKEELEKLESKGADFITYEEYENLDFVKDLPEDERKSNLKLLSMIGAVVSYVDDPRLIDTNVINPQWIMDGVYAIINDSKVKDDNKGRLHINDLGRILPPKKFPKARHVYLLDLMRKFNLCYGAKDEPHIYFIPDLFEDIEPDFEWDEEASIHFRYNYDDFSPDVFMTRFIVEMHQDIQDEKRWRSGVYITNGSCQAKVYQAYRKNYIHIEVVGNKGEGRSYLYAIRDTFRKLHKPFPQMNITQEVQYKGHWLEYDRLINREVKNREWYHDELDEDLPITDILNGYSSLSDRKGAQKHIKIFLASSAELKEEREQFEIFIHRENQQLYKQGIFIEVQLWENFIDAMSQTRLQDEYNMAVRHSDIFVSLFFTKVGKYTLEEFETAFGQFKRTGKPLVYTYFKEADINTGKLTKEIKTLFAFQDKLEELGHYRTTYKSIEDLQLQFKKQLEKILPNYMTETGKLNR